MIPEITQTVLSIPATVLSLLRIRKMLAEGKKVNLTHSMNSANSGCNIEIPPGKLASFYWYQRDPQLYQDEVAAMKRFFPTFQLGKLSDGKLYWYGKIRPKIIGNNEWHLQLVYENNHPDNSTYGGAIKVYVIDPDIDVMNSELGNTIPHLLRDSRGNTYLCTARKEDVQIGNVVTTAASTLTWAVKWVAVFELWLAGTITREQFAGHDNF